ncbi:PspC domain-containing protein [Corynebacterium aquatimens]|uniref:Phage shock protein PspC (Stress-responsive transcriptional regulator) n=1 Tax=Corynebacterium aquatimens TaxID=1190508 RepID=A0A931DWE7_9CORY|nr:PspC domain-containing protein [Corynebacterium aquatimens]MBG6121340.1 phage shock protein PspC (stress-responsive transcriptional regulator) [Corynebacterium aquatimens]WJY66113.1 DNA-binding transcriptional activator PspC [Corynebacterium aquatimens]
MSQPNPDYVPNPNVNVPGANPIPPQPVLVRPRTDRIIAGVCAGLADHFNIDHTLMRVIFVFLTLAGFSGVLAYLVCWAIIPEQKI